MFSKSWFFPTTRLNTACSKNDLATVQALADASNVNTPGFLAASAGNAEIVRYLLSDNLKANVDILDQEKHTPLMLAAGASTGETEDRVLTVKLLLAHKANANASDEGKYTPLHLAVLNDNRRIVEILLEAGAKVNFQNLDRFTALHAAAGVGNAALVQLLLAKGADASIKDGRGKTAADHAKEAGFDFEKLRSPEAKAAYMPPAIPVVTGSVEPAKTAAITNEIAKELADLEAGAQK